MIGRDEPTGADLLDPDELDHYVTAFERTGFRGTADWFRNPDHDWASTRGQDPHYPCRCSTHTANKATGYRVPGEIALMVGDYTDDFEWHLLDGVGHWTRQEAPEEVNRLLLAWLDRITG